ncbi:hypothetical protein GCM10027176_26350 [Actinoallomurus bryophytorum]
MPHPATPGRLVDRLARQGLDELTPNPADRQAQQGLIELTPDPAYRLDAAGLRHRTHTRRRYEAYSPAHPAPAPPTDSHHSDHPHPATPHHPPGPAARRVLVPAANAAFAPVMEWPPHAGSRVLPLPVPERSLRRCRTPSSPR